MNLPFALGTLPLPDWLPWWVPAVLAIPLVLYLLLALLVPFGTFGVKSRLDDIELQLEELRGDVRELAMRLAPADEPPRQPEPRDRFGDARTTPRPAGVRAEPRLGPR